MADIEADRGARLAAELGDRCRFLRTDVAVEGAIDAAVDLAMTEFGGLDCLFNNAGNPGSIGGIEEIDMATFDRTVAIHLRGMFLGIRAAARVMRPVGRGSIINTASVAGLSGGYGGHDYSACKAAIIQLTKTTANELGEDGIRVNAICPGGIATAIFARAMGLDVEVAQRTVGFMTAAMSEAAPIRRAGAARRHRRGGALAGRRRLGLRQRPGDCRRRRPADRPAAAQPARRRGSAGQAGVPGHADPGGQPGRCQPGECQPGECQPGECQLADPAGWPRSGQPSSAPVSGRAPSLAVHFSSIRP